MSAATKEPLRVAALQYCAGGSFDETLPQLESLITSAAGGGAGLVCLPEAATFLAANRRSLDAEAEWEDDSPTLRRLSTLAADLGIDLLVGSTFVRRRQDSRIVNRSVLIGADGTVALESQLESILADAFEAVGDDGVITVAATKAIETEPEVAAGMASATRPIWQRARRRTKTATAGTERLVKSSAIGAFTWR